MEKVKIIYFNKDLSPKQSTSHTLVTDSRIPVIWCTRIFIWLVNYGSRTSILCIVFLEFFFH